MKRFLCLCSCLSISHFASAYEAEKSAAPEKAPHVTPILQASIKKPDLSRLYIFPNQKMTKVQWRLGNQNWQDATRYMTSKKTEAFYTTETLKPSDDMKIQVRAWIGNNQVAINEVAMSGEGDEKMAVARYVKVERAPMPSLQEIAQMRANQLAANSPNFAAYDSSAHNIPGAVPTPSNVWEGIGRGSSPNNIPTCENGRQVLADAIAPGRNGQYYRVRFFSRY